MLYGIIENLRSRKSWRDSRNANAHRIIRPHKSVRTGVRVFGKRDARDVESNSLRGERWVTPLIAIFQIGVRTRYIAENTSPSSTCNDDSATRTWRAIAPFSFSLSLSLSSSLFAPCRVFARTLRSRVQRTRARLRGFHRDCERLQAQAVCARLCDYIFSAHTSVRKIVNRERWPTMREKRIKNYIY